MSKPKVKPIPGFASEGEEQEFWATHDTTEYFDWSQARRVVFPKLKPSTTPGPVLLYDGFCGFCSGLVRFVLKHDRKGALLFAPLQGDFARQLVARHPQLAGVDSLILVEQGSAEGEERVYARSAGALRMAHHLGGPWRLARGLVLVPRFLRDWAYDLFARHRYRVFGRLDSCFLPTEAERARFLE